MTQIELGALAPETIVFQQDLAQALGCTTKSVMNLSKQGHLPAPFRIGKTPVWLAGSVSAHFQKAAIGAAKIAADFQAKVRQHTA